MSWDVMLVRLRSGLMQAQDITEGAIIPLGSHAAVREILRAVWPEDELSKDGYGYYEGYDFDTEFSLTHDPVDGFTLFVHGFGTDVLDAIRQFRVHLEDQALATTAGDFIDFTREPSAGFRQWQAYRDACMRALQAGGELATATDDEDGGKGQ